MLEGDVHILANVITLTHHRQQVIGEMRRIPVMQTNPLHARDVGYPLHQFRQGHSLIAIEAIKRKILGDHLEFFHALRDQATHLVYDLVHRTGLISPGYDRDRTVRTSTVASLPDLHVSVVPRGGEHTIRSQLLMVRLAQIGDQLLPIEFPVETIYLGKFLLQIFQETLRQAPHHEELPDPSFLLLLAQLEDHIDRFLLGVADETAGIHHHDLAIDLMGIMLYRIAIGNELAHKLLRVH